MAAALQLTADKQAGEQTGQRACTHIPPAPLTCTCQSTDGSAHTHTHTSGLFAYAWDAARRLGACTAAVGSV